MVSEKTNLRTGRMVQPVKGLAGCIVVVFLADILRLWHRGQR